MLAITVGHCQFGWYALAYQTAGIIEPLLMCQALYGDYHLIITTTLHGRYYINTQFREEETEVLGLSDSPQSHRYLSSRAGICTQF